jgi:hypothetical protein
MATVSMIYMILHNGLWYLVEVEHGRARLYQLEVNPPTITWRDCPDGTTPVINVTPTERDATN